MHLRQYVYLAALLSLVACGQPETSGPAEALVSTPVSQQDVHTIADLLQEASALGTPAVVDAYHWVGFRRSARLSRDAQGCPIFSTSSVLTDWPVTGVLHLPTMSMTNWSAEYPPADAPWLIPILAGEPPAEIPYHARLRGHLGDPAFSQCTHADRIFVVEQVDTVYQQLPPLEHQVKQVQPPADYTAWPRYHDSKLGYSVAYAPDWDIASVEEAGMLSAVGIRLPQWPDSPIMVRVHAGETHRDPYDLTTVPALLKGLSGGLFNTDFVGLPNSKPQHLSGTWVEREDDPNMQVMSILISAHGRTYEMALRYPIGLHAQQPLLDAYTLLVGSFQLDMLPEPSPTPPVKQVVGAGPFVSQEEALAEVKRRNGPKLELLDAQLVSEAELRRLGSGCGTFFGHPEGIWLLQVRGTFDGVTHDGATETALVGINATTGKQLCGQIVTTDTPMPTVPLGTIEPAETPVISPIPAATSINQASQPYPAPTSAP